MPSPPWRKSASANASEARRIGFPENFLPSTFAPETMRSITLGSSSLSVSRLAYGCWRIAGGPDPAGVTPAEEAGGRAVIAAFEAGCTLFDLADVYCEGVCEKIFGAALREVSGMRERVVIASKCGIRKRGEPDAFAPYRYDFSAAHLVKSVEQSLQRIGIETLDVLLLHRPDFLCDPAEVAGAFSGLRQAGKVREFGVSNFSPSQFTALQSACPMRLLANQVEISLACLGRFTDGTLDHCLAEKITPMAWSPLAGGRLTETLPIDINAPDHAKRIAVRETLEEIARVRRATRAQIAFAWLLKHPAGIIPIIGSANVKHIQAAAQAAAIELSREEWYRLMEAAHGQRLP